MQDSSGEVAALRRKLEALNYIDGLDSLNAYSAPLAKRLLEDVVHTTERYRSLKMQETRKSYELEGERKKVDLLRQENGRLLKENNELHLARMKEAEAARAKERTDWLAKKRTEDELAELRFWKTQAVVQYESLEKVKNEMQEQLQKKSAGKSDMDTFQRTPFAGSSPRLQVSDALVKQLRCKKHVLMHRLLIVYTEETFARTKDLM